MEDEEFDEEYVGVNEERNSERERGKAGAGRGEREPQITVLGHCSHFAHIHGHDQSKLYYHKSNHL